jgi:hypothetical protein
VAESRGRFRLRAHVYSCCFSIPSTSNSARRASSAGR